MPNAAGVDQNFDDIASKFERNIYGTSKGRLRHELLLHHLNSQLDLHSQALTILDAGGGTGVMSASMAALGHQVTLSDVSADSLKIAEAKFKDQYSLHYVHSDIQSLPEQSYDLVVCHAVLEWLSEPFAILPKLCDLVAPSGHLSLSFFNLDAFRFGNLLYGNFDYIKQGMKRPNQVRLNPQQPLAPKAVLSALSELPLSIELKTGIRCFHDYMLDRELRESKYAELKAMEIEYGPQEPYLWLGKYFQIIAKRKG